jgi:hypothetical protein
MADTDLFQEDDLFSNAGEKSSELPTGGNIYVHSADSMGSLSQTARAIMDELKDWHKRVEKHGSKEVHPSYLLTLDKIPETLNKFNTLSAQAKSEQAVHLAIRQITDHDHRGQHRVAYIYPFLVRSGNKIQSKICIFAPQKESKTDAVPFRTSCFKASQELMDMILSHRAKKIRVVDEDNPGAFLFAKTKNEETWLYPKFGAFEAEINHIVRKGFHPIPPIPIPEFLQDFIFYAKSHQAVIPILNDYHVIVDELNLNEDGTFQTQPEIINQYRAQVDGLEKFAMNQLRKLAAEMKYENFVHELDDFHSNFISTAQPGRKQSSDKANALIKLVESFPLDQATSNFGKRVRETIHLSLKILKKLIQEKDMILERKDESLYVKIRKEVLDRIPEFTKNNSTLMKMNFREEIEKMGVKEESRIEDLSERLKEDVLAKYSYHELKKDNGDSLFFIVDHGYMAAVMHKLASEADKNPEYKRQLDIARSINDKLSNPKHPELNSKLKPEDIVKLSSHVREIERLNQEKLRNQEFQKKVNLPAGLLAFVASTLIFVTGSYYLQSLIPIVFGVPFSSIVGVFAAYFFREKSREELRKEVMESGKISAAGLNGDFNSGSASFGDNTSSRSGGDDSDPKKEAKVVDIYKAADGHIFPQKFNKITDKVLELKTIQKRIYASLKDIRRKNLNLAKEKDDDKVASTVEYAIVQSCSIINVPNDVALRTMPNTLYILKNDLKSPLFREQLADQYREEMNKKKFDKKLVKYYTFLINTVEMEYYKYLPKKKL